MKQEVIVDQNELEYWVTVNPILFTENIGPIHIDDHHTIYSLNEYQIDLFKQMEKNLLWTNYTFPRQCGLTTGILLYILYRI